MQPTLALLVEGLPISSQQHPYFREIEMVTRSLASMSNVSQLSILRPTELLQSPPSRDFFESLCLWIQEHYTQLQSLRISVENTSLRFLYGLRNLKILGFSGFSVTQPEELLDILTHLHYLEEMRVIGPPQGLRRRQRYGYQHRFVVQSFTDSVLNGMKPLKKLTMCEVAVLAHDEPSFLTEKILEAIYLTHRHSLRELTIYSETSLEPSIESLLRAFLMSTTTLAKLSMGWPGMNMSVVDSLPVSLCHLTVAVPGLRSQEPIRSRLRAVGSRLPYLRSIDFAGFNGIR
jgi:hypothetical protein